MGVFGSIRVAFIALAGAFKVYLTPSQEQPDPTRRRMDVGILVTLAGHGVFGLIDNPKLFSYSMIPVQPPRPRLWYRPYPGEIVRLPQLRPSFWR